MRTVAAFLCIFLGQLQGFDYLGTEHNSFELLPKPEKEITTKQIQDLLHEVSFEMRDFDDLQSTIFPAYLANAQYDYYKLSGGKGDLGPVTLWTLQLFKPNAKLHSVDEASFDPFSSGIAALIVSKAADRLKDEMAGIKDYPIRQGKDLWSPTSPGYVGLKYGSAKTWYLKNSSEFAAVNPRQDRQYWKDQCNRIKTAQADLTPEKMFAVFWWAGLTGPEAGRWTAILNEYLKENPTTVEKELQARATFESALADSNAAAFNSKYSYWVPRPSQKDSGVHPKITIPNHPSYPSAHSTIGKTAAMVLSQYFPENKTEWNSLAEEAGVSRIWGGIHYPCDHTAGLDLGSKVGKAVLTR